MTARPAFELADVFRRHGETYAQLNAGHLGRVERRVSAAIAACRTAALGGHVERCDDCGLTRIAYNSCRNRHCPKCQGAARVKWLAARQAELLPVPYFHVVFTLPSAAAEIAFQNKRTVYGLLMRAAAQALSVLAAKRLGARIGLIAVLHTWGQTLTHHPHVHCLVPGGGVALDNRRWVEAKPNFLLSVHALSKAFRRLFLDGLKAESEKGELSFFGELARLAEPEAFKARMRALRQSPFVVYAKPPFGGPARVLAYLAPTPIARRSPIRGLSPSTTMKWRSSTRIIAAAAAAASCASPRTSSSDVFSSTSYPTACIAFVTTVSSPKASAAKSSHMCETCSTSRPSRRSRSIRRRRRAATQKPTPFATPSCAAQIAGASCAALKPSRPGPPAPFAATRHDNNAPAAPRMRSSQFSQLGHPSRGASLRPLALKLIFEAVRAPTTPTSSHSRPWFSFILAIVGLNDFAEPVRGPLVRHMASDRQRASPIAPHPDRGFVQSGLCEVAIRDAQPAPQRPHITLQILTASS